MQKIYRSKVDARLGAILGGLPLLMLFVIWSLFNKAVPGAWAIAILFVLLGICLPLSILACTSYTITEESLLIRCGMLKWEIPIKDISSIEPTRNPQSSPALSLDRLRIEYGGGKSIMVSPEKSDAFLRDLRSVEAVAVEVWRQP